MKKYMKTITSAEESQEDRIKDMLNDLEDDFDFALSGIERILRDDSNAGAEIASNLSESIQDIIAQIADKLQEVAE